MDSTAPFVIIGNGIAGVTAAETLRAGSPQAPIVLIAGDTLPVYYRPALKDYLAGRVGEEQLRARPLTFYSEQQIYCLADHVVGLDSRQRLVYMQSGLKISYTRLLLANGSRPRRLHCPGHDLSGVTTLRSVADYQTVLAGL